MASHVRDNIVHGRNHNDQHLDEGRWRHQESSSYARHASPARIRAADDHSSTQDLAAFLGQTRAEPLKAEPGKAVASAYKPIVVPGLKGEDGVKSVNGAYDGSLNGVNGNGNNEAAISGNGVVGEGPDATDAGAGAQNGTNGTLNQGGSQDGREVRCGPLLNYRRAEGNKWYGSVLIVVRGGGSSAISEFSPVLLLKKLGHDLSSSQNGELAHSSETLSAETKVEGIKLYSDPRNTFWRFTIGVEMEQNEVHWGYKIPGLRFPGDSQKTDEQSFFVPAATESMRIMFHSCNGFSVGTDEASWSGAALWNDVARKHREHPFHVMLGGGDQIYNDGIRVSGPLRPWTDISNPKKRREYPFPEKLRKECDDYYVSNYIRWYSTEPFAACNGKIPQLNLWDDHDIIDGFGSYVHEFMKCDVFRGIGGCAYKYYMLFQHHLPPPVSTYTTDAPQTMESSPGGTKADPAQLRDTYVLEGEEEDPSYIIGPKPGPYVAERSRSIYAKLGARIAFFGIDARTERTRHQVNYPETYQLIMNRLKSELSAAANGPEPMQHIIVLLGIPIAYPRLTWLENIFSSPLMGPIKFLNKRFGVGGGLFNHFDGSVDLLDDLDDHYTSRTHKRERHELIMMLQDLAAQFSVRVTILGGDVHLAALGRFYSNPKLKIPVEADHRYMANIISSAIVNKPPPQAVANLLARRNKLHHLDENTDETLLRFFDKDPGHEAKTSNSNHVTMPSRNWAMITENSRLNARSGEATTNGAIAAVDPSTIQNGTAATPISANTATGKDGHFPLHAGEQTAGSNSRAAIESQHGTAGDGSLDICINVERDQHDKEGKTTSYGMWIPKLQYTKGDYDDVLRKRDAIQGAVAARTGHRTHE